MKTSVKCILVALFLSLNLFPTTSTWSATAHDINKEIRNAQKFFFRGDAEKADEILKNAEALAAEVMTGSNAAEKQKVERLLGRMQKLRHDIDRKLGKSTDSAKKQTSTQILNAEKASTTTVKSDALPSHVRSDLRTVDRYLGVAQENLKSGKTGYARRALTNARQKLEQIAERKKRYISPGHPEYLAMQQRLDDLDAQVSTAEKAEIDKKGSDAKAAADAQAQSDQWIAKLKPYVTGMGQPGYDPERYFVAGFTEDQKEMAKRTIIYDKVSADMEAYSTSGPGNNASDELQRIVRDIEHAMKSFQESSTSMAELKLSNAGRKIDYITEWLAKEEKKIGTKDLPATMNKMSFMTAGRDLDRASNLLGTDDTRIKTLETKYQAAVLKNAQLAKARVSQTRMIADKFSGSELGMLKTKAQEILAAAKPGVTILRTTVVSKDWNEENVIEWTDTSRSTLRHRITYSVSAQVAGKNGSDTTLYTLHIAKDRRSDGKWSPLKGHIMFEDPIFEENVNK